MFQNMTENLEEQEINVSKVNLVLRELLKVQNVIICILTLLMSVLSIDNDIVPFGLAMVAASLGSGIPVFGVIISALVGTLAGNGIKSFFNFVFSLIIYLALVLIYKPKIAIDERNELIKTGKRLFLACFIVYFFQNIKGIILTYDVFVSLVSASLTYVFYKIFVNGLAIIKEWGNKNAFTLEEIISTAIIISIASVVLSKVHVWGLNISNIIIIFLVMLLGLKHGMLVGCTTGLSLGLVVSMLEMQNGMQIAVFAVAGIVAGLLNKFGKIGVILGFILGNSLLIYLTNGDTIRIIYFREIFISAIGLLLVPNKVKIDIENLVNPTRLLGNNGENRLNQSDEIINKLNNISDTISELVPDKQEKIEDLKEDFKDILFDNLEEISDNIFYEEIIQEDNNIANEIYKHLQKNDLILEKDLIYILKNHNNYIIIQDNEIKEELLEIIKVINKSYKMAQMEVIKVQEKNNNLKNMKKGFENISKAINNVVKTNENNSKSEFYFKEKELSVLLKNKYPNTNSVKIKQSKNGKFIVNIEFSNDRVKDKQYIANICNILSKSLISKMTFYKDVNEDKYIQTYMSEDKYSLQIGISKVTQDGSSVSGDCSLQMKLDDGKYLLALSDGMGSGKASRESSRLTIKMLEECLSKGYDNDETINFINDAVNSKTDSEMYSTLDFAILDLFTGNVKIAKSGACNTYIKNKKNVRVVKSKTLPVGIVEKIELDTQTINVSDGDIIVMCSDGLLDENGIDKDWIEEYLKNISTTNVQKVADLVVAESIDRNFGIAKDDITVIIAKVVKKK